MVEVSSSPHAQDASCSTEVSKNGSYSPSVTQVVEQANNNH